MTTSRPSSLTQVRARASTSSGLSTCSSTYVASTTSARSVGVKCSNIETTPVQRGSDSSSATFLMRAAEPSTETTRSKRSRRSGVQARSPTPSSMTDSPLRSWHTRCAISAMRKASTSLSGVRSRYWRLISSSSLTEASEQWQQFGQGIGDDVRSMLFEEGPSAHSGRDRIDGYPCPSRRGDVGLGVADHHRAGGRIVHEGGGLRPLLPVLEDAKVADQRPKAERFDLPLGGFRAAPECADHDLPPRSPGSSQKG